MESLFPKCPEAGSGLSENNRYHFLDSSRGLAAFVVLLAHTIKTFSPDHYLSPFDIFWDAEAAVLYFFVLSGFVLTESIKNTKLSFQSYLTFIARRVLRIYPVFLIILFSAFMLLNYFNAQQQGWLMEYWLRFPAISDVVKEGLLIVRIPNDPALRLLPHDWTLSVEIMISLALPFLAWSAKKNSLLLLLLVYFTVKVLPVDPFIFDFTLGCILSVNKGLLLKLRERISVQGLLAILIAGLLLIKADRLLPFDSRQLDLVFIHHKTWGVILLLITLLFSSQLQSVLNKNIFVFQGRISYSFYLIHFILIAVLYKFQPEKNLISALFIVFFSTTFLSFVTYYLIERPFIQLGRKFRIRKD